MTLDVIAEECSGAGGTHAVFQLDGTAASPEFAHFGGHAVQLPVASAMRRSNLNASSAGEEAGLETGRVYVAGLEPSTRTPNRGWCMEHLPDTKWQVVVLIPVLDAEEGAQLLDEVGAR